MQIQKIKVEGFRLLENLEVCLEADTPTVIVGRNNSGKTSLTDVFDRLMSEKGPSFRLEDFSSGVRGKFLGAKKLLDSGADAKDILAALPTICLTITFTYDKAAKDVGPLSPFIIDLDENSTTAIVRIEYAASLSSVKALLTVPDAPEGQQVVPHFFKQIKETVVKAYSVNVFAIDPTHENNRRKFDGIGELNALLQCSFIGAERTLDTSKPSETAVIGKMLSSLFRTARSENASIADQQLAESLKLSVDGVQQTIQGDFDGKLKELLPALAVFGFPSLNDTELHPETTLDVEALLAGHTKLLYTGVHGVHLPEGYNGLGTRHLIFMLLRLQAFHKEYRSRTKRPSTHLIFVEEPEVHLHPQMQEVFIAQLTAAVKELSKQYPNEEAWRVQFVVTTHSSHIANAATFEAIRYFFSSVPDANGVRHTSVKDFRRGLDSISQQDKDFLHQYMTLTKCDLYFADKAIMVEGTTERILMPRICKLIDEELASELKLARQYLTTVECGGANAKTFYPLLDFLELKTLIITDLDTVLLDDTKKPKRWIKCPVAQGARTSNSAIKGWFDVEEGKDLSPNVLIEKKSEDKMRGVRRIAYQIPEPNTEGCARSFEDALILANRTAFNLDEKANVAEEAWELAQDFHKSETALKYAMLEEKWNVPFYIKEGLKWLAEPPPPPAEEPPLAPVTADEGAQ
jgi:predicted ATP-dependent endonuclease of OLD family